MIARAVVVTALVVGGASPLAANPAAPAISQLSKQVPNVRDETPQPEPPNARSFIELYSTVGKHLGQLSRRDPDAAEDLLPRYRYIQPQAAMQHASKRRIAIQQLVEIERLIALRCNSTSFRTPSSGSGLEHLP